MEKRKREKLQEITSTDFVRVLHGAMRTVADARNGKMRQRKRGRVKTRNRQGDGDY